VASEVGKRKRCEQCGAEIVIIRDGGGKVRCCSTPMVARS
jgi:Desulfoferrodoxin, N-terminal domain